MEVSVKYNVISKATIGDISLNENQSFLAAVADGNDTASFFAVKSLDVIPVLNGESRPPSLGCIAWSPDGKIVAVGGSRVELWKFENMKLAPIHVFKEGFVEIKSISWSYDSCWYLCIGIIPKNERISLNIRNVDTQESRKIYVDDSIVSASFDPFGKYVAVLLKKNVLQLYDQRSLEKVKQISMANLKNDPFSIKDLRIMDWSPDYSYLFVPNLNDAKVPNAVLFDRNAGFKVKSIFLGHQSPINCVKFSPHIYQYNHQICYIAAIGDSSGCLSLWRISKASHNLTPLFIASSPYQAEESIEKIEWDKEGSHLYLNVLKKYVVCIKINDEQFGRRLEADEKVRLILSIYGASGASQITGSKLEVFGMVDTFQQSTFSKPQFVPNFDAVQTFQPKQQEMIKTEQQVFFLKGKKRINPSRMIPKEATQGLEKKSANHNDGNNLPNSFNEQQLLSTVLPRFKMPLLNSKIKSEYIVDRHKKLFVNASGGLRVLTIVNDSESGITEKKRFFPSDVNHIEILSSTIIVVHSQKLYCFNFALDLQQLPIFMGEVSALAVNNQGAVFYLLSNGIIRGFNYQMNKFILQTSLAYICAGSSETIITEMPLSVFRVYDNDNNKIHIEVKSSRARWFYSAQACTWLQMDFLNGLYKPGHSLRVTQSDKASLEQFFNNILSKQRASASNKPQQIVSSNEMDLVYYRKHDNNEMKYKEALLKLIVETKRQGTEDELRSLIARYCERDSPDYIEDQYFWRKVSSLGGTVIEQFIILREQ